MLRPLSASASSLPATVSKEADELLLDRPGLIRLASRLDPPPNRGEIAEGSNVDEGRAGDTAAELGRVDGPASSE